MAQDAITVVGGGLAVWERHSDRSGREADIDLRQLFRQ